MNKRTHNTLWLLSCLFLTACNGGSSSAPPPENALPIANAGADITVNQRELVTLNGSASHDQDDDYLSYKWLQVSGPEVKLSSESDDTPSFIAPEIETILRYQLVISDGKDNSLPDTVTITIIDNSSDSSDSGQDNNNSGSQNNDNGGSNNNSNSNDNDNNTSNPDDNSGDTGNDSNNDTDTGSDNNSTDNNSDNNTDNSDSSDSTNDDSATPVNNAPVANAGEDQSITGANLVTLDASQSADPDGDTLTYQWNQISGTAVSLNDDSVELPSFIAPNINDTLIFSLTVSDGIDSSTADQVEITLNELITNTAPVAVAGDDQTVNVNDYVTLNALGSYDNEDDTLSYSWIQISGDNVNLNNRHTHTAHFYAPENGGTLEFSLTVSDGELESETDHILINVNTASSELIAHAGDDQRVKSSEQVTLDASQSYATDGSTLSYVWRQVGGTTVSLSDPNSVSPQFTAPVTDTFTPLTLTFSLYVNDGQYNSTRDTVNISVDNRNQAPIANAGSAATVEGTSTVTLDGTLSSDPDGDNISFNWTQVSGTSVDITGSDTASPSFIAPREGGTLQFSLTVNDGQTDSDASVVTITALPLNLPPIANAGVDRYVGSLSIVALKGSRSSDPDDNPITYAWTQLSGPNITLSDASSANPTFEAHTDGQLVFQLIVNDGQLDSEPDTMNVTVGPIPATNIKVNGTGITWGANYPTGNNLDCSGELIELQDCSLGRELTHNDDVDGRAGFSFTKFDEDGVETDSSNPEWSCVQDAVTGLMWEVKAGGNDTHGDEGLNDADDKYSWYNPDASSNGGAEGFADSKGEQCYGYDENSSTSFCNTQAFVDRMNSAGWCGYADWRLPTRKELLSIVDYGNQKPMLDNDYFPSNAALTWTSTPFAIGTTSAWGVNFEHGNSFSLDKRNANQIRLVRGGYE